MRQICTSLFVWFALALAVFPVQAARADNWWYPYTLGTHTTLSYYPNNIGSSLYGPVQNAMAGWNSICANRWGPSSCNGPFRLDTGNPGDVGQIVMDYSGWGYGAGYAGYTNFGADSNGVINYIKTEFNADPNNGCDPNQHIPFTFNTGTVSSGCSISTQDLMVHELGFAVSLHEMCYPANPDFGTPADTVQNSVMCDYTLSQNHTGPQSNDVPAVVYIYN